MIENLIFLKGKKWFVTFQIESNLIRTCKTIIVEKSGRKCCLPSILETEICYLRERKNTDVRVLLLNV